MGVQRAAAAVALAVIMLAGCAQTTPAREALTGETLAWEQIQGADIVAEAVVDGSSSGLLGKPSNPTVNRHLEPSDGSTPQELLDQLIAESLAQGWEHDDPSTDPYRATKQLDTGPGTLLSRSTSSSSLPRHPDHEHAIVDVVGRMS